MVPAERDHSANVVNQRRRLQKARKCSSSYIFYDADQGDGVAGLRVVLVAPQDEGRGNQHVQVEVVRLDADLRRNLERKREKRE